jgi:hypothetical protein
VSAPVVAADGFATRFNLITLMMPALSETERFDRLKNGIVCPQLDCCAAFQDTGLQAE